MVGLLTYAIGVYIEGFGEVTSLIFPSIGPTSSLLLGESLIAMGTFVGVCGLPCLILLLFLVLKYRGACLCIFLLCLIGVLKVAKVAATSYSVVPRDKLVCFGGIFVSLGSVVFSGLDFSCFSPSSFSSCFPPTSTSSSSTILFSSVSLSSSSDPAGSSSFVLAPSSHSYVFPSLPPTLEAGVSPGVRVCVSMKASLSMPMNLDQRTWILNLLKASTTISLMRPWWPRCWCFPSFTFDSCP